MEWKLPWFLIYLHKCKWVRFYLYHSIHRTGSSGLWLMFLAIKAVYLLRRKGYYFLLLITNTIWFRSLSNYLGARPQIFNADIRVVFIHFKFFVLSMFYHIKSSLEVSALFMLGLEQWTWRLQTVCKMTSHHKLCQAFNWTVISMDGFSIFTHLVYWMVDFRHPDSGSWSPGPSQHFCEETKNISSCFSRLVEVAQAVHNSRTPAF